MPDKTINTQPEDGEPEETTNEEQQPVEGAADNTSQTPPANESAKTDPKSAPKSTGASEPDPDDLIPAKQEDVEQMLMFAWQRFNGYDAQSGESKKKYRRFREYIIAITLTTTFLAIISSFAQANQLPIFKSILVALPLISAGLLAYVTRFESGNAWVGFRVAAENIRRGIYSLRIKFKLEKATVGDLKRLDKLICETSQMLESLGVTTPVLNPNITLSRKKVKPNWVDVPDEDDGYTPMTLDDYRNWRIMPQTEWYYGRIKRDYQRTRRWRSWILLVGGMGALVAAIGWTVWVAFVVALTSGLIAMLGLRQYEVNYGNYMRTVRKIEDTLRHFTITFDDSTRDLTDKDKTQILDFVKVIEDAFSEEREVWRFAILQSQEATESAIAQMVSSYSTTGFPADDLLKIPGQDDNGDGDNGDNGDKSDKSGKGDNNDDGENGENGDKDGNGGKDEEAEENPPNKEDKRV